jgi:hypothetical protein
MGWLSKLFGHERPASASEPAAAEVQARTLLGFLIPQLDLLGLEREKVPVGGSFTSKRSRGYIYGTAAAVLGETTAEQDAEMVEDIMQAAFTLVWGAERAQEIFEITLAECAARDGETLAGTYRAEADVRAVYAGRPGAAVMGFWLLNNGLNDPRTIMPKIENPLPLSPSA